MPSAINAMFAIQGPEGLTFGYVFEITLEKIVFEIDSRLAVGDEIEWRMELKGYPETGMGRLIVERSRKSEVPGVSLFHARISHLEPGERELLTGWIKDIEEGGTSRRIERKPELYVQGLLDIRKSDVSPEERLAAVDRIDARRAWARQFSKKKTSFFGDEQTSDPLGLHASEGSEPGARAPQDFDPEGSILAALMENMEPLGAEEQPGDDQEWEDPGEPAEATMGSTAWAPPGVDLELARALSESSEWLLGAVDDGPVTKSEAASQELFRAPDELLMEFDPGEEPAAVPLSSPEPLAPPEPATPPEPVAPPPPSAPEISVDKSSKPVQVLLRYPDQESFRSDYKANLKNRGCSIPAEGLALWTPLSCTFLLPSGQSLTCKGEVVGSAGALAFVALKTTDSDRQLLAREAQGS